jgi:hypothetical protein
MLAITLTLPPHCSQLSISSEELAREIEQW